MPEVIILGSAAALPSAKRENTYLVVRDAHSAVLVDCAGSPIQRLQEVGVNPVDLDGLIITHHHPDHIYGVPALILGLWLLGRKDSLHIYGPLKGVASVASLMEILDAGDWPRLFSTTFHAVQLTENFPVMETSDFLIHATPVAHMVACIALRFTSKKTGRVMVYSSDTEPCESLVRLGRGADLLLHEATGPEKGHSTAAQAGAMGRLMGAKRLVLVHLPVNHIDLNAWRRDAEREFGAPVELAEDLSRFEF